MSATTTELAVAPRLAPHEEIKTMKLYHHVDRIERRLRELDDGDNNAAHGDAIDPEVLARVDSLHFLGDEPVRHIEQLLGDSQHKTVLDVGTGYGGTARLLAHRSGCHVHALELQPELFSAGRELTRRCGLGDRVTHELGDFLAMPATPQLYDVVVGLLCFLHIGRWHQLFQKCHDSLSSGGFLFVEDFFVRGDELPEQDTVALRDEVYCASLLRRPELLAALARCGFRRVEFRDRTQEWTPFVVQRAEAYRAKLAEHIERDGEETARGLDHFYATVARLFQGGNVGGYTLVAWKD